MSTARILTLKFEVPADPGPRRRHEADVPCEWTVGDAADQFLDHLRQASEPGPAGRRFDLRVEHHPRRGAVRILDLRVTVGDAEIAEGDTLVVVRITRPAPGVEERGDGRRDPVGDCIDGLKARGDEDTAYLLQQLYAELRAERETREEQYRECHARINELQRGLIDVRQLVVDAKPNLRKALDLTRDHAAEFMSRADGEQLATNLKDATDRLVAVETTVDTVSRNVTNLFGVLVDGKLHFRLLEPLQENPAPAGVRSETTRATETRR